MSPSDWPTNPPTRSSPLTAPVACDKVMSPDEYPTKPPTSQRPLTSPDAEESAISPSDLPTNPPTWSPTLVTSPFAFDLVIVPFAPSSPTNPPILKLVPVTSPFMLESIIAPAEYPTNPPTTSTPVTFPVTFTFSTLPPNSRVFAKAPRPCTPVSPATVSRFRFLTTPLIWSKSGLVKPEIT